MQCVTAISSLRSLIISTLLIAVSASAQPLAGFHNQSDKAAAFYEQGQAAQQRGDNQSATLLYSKAIEADQTLFQPYYQRAIALMALDRASQAEADLKKVLELNQNFAKAHKALGQLMLDQGKTEDAKREFARALEIDPKLVGVRMYFASALLKTNEPAAAIEQLRTAIQQGEVKALTYALLGLGEERTGKSAEAFEDYSHSIKLNPDEPIAREGRARLMEAKGELAKAIEDYTTLYRVQPSPELALKLAAVHAKAGQPQASINIYREHLRLHPEDFTIRAEMMTLMSENGQKDQAARDLAALINAQPANAKVVCFAGDFYANENPEAASGYYRRAMELEPKNNEARAKYGASLVRSRQFDAALPVLSEAISRDSGNYQAHASLGTALFELKRYPEAAAEFIWIVRAKPELATGYYFLAISLDRIGDCDQALRGYREFMKKAGAQSAKEMDDARIRVSLLEKLAKEGRCKPLPKGKAK